MAHPAGLTLAAALAALGLIATAVHDPAAAETWDELVAAANKEGTLVIKGAPGKVYSEVLTEAFKKKYPGIKVSYTGLNGFESIPKISREREAGIYNWDIYIGGTPSTLSSLKPAGAFAPLPPV